MEPDSDCRVHHIVLAIELLNPDMSEWNPETIAGWAVAALAEADSRAFARLRDISVPVYATDAKGWITFHNAACQTFSGRPRISGEDRWCVSWKLRTRNGVPLPHDECPMADCVRDARAVRGLSAIAERPDGRLFVFTPYPTPVFTRDGSFAGAINLFTDVREQSEASRLNIEAQRYRRAAGALGDLDTVALLLDIADGYEAELKEALTRH